MLVKKLMPSSPKCFNITGEILSGPMALEFLAFLIALRVCSGVIKTAGSEVFFRILRKSLLNSFEGLVVVPGVY